MENEVLTHVYTHEKRNFSFSGSNLGYSKYTLGKFHLSFLPTVFYLAFLFDYTLLLNLYKDQRFTLICKLLYILEQCYQR